MESHYDIMKDLDFYIKRFEKMRPDYNKIRYTTGKSPHKPILLLSLILLKKNDRIDLNNIQVDLDLRETWNDLWSCLEYNKSGPIHLPLFHLIRDEFYKIDFMGPTPSDHPKSLLKFKSEVRRIYLEEDLIRLMDDDVSRRKMISSLLTMGHFSEIEKSNLVKMIDEVDISFIVEDELIRKVKDEFNSEMKVEDEYLPPRRNPAFRRSILRAYDETCAVCGMKLQTTYGILVIDAAHILPFYRFHNDDIRNGLALCKMHHWLFDRGIISIDPHYRIIVSKTVEREQPESVISRYHKEDLKVPEKGEYFPHPIATEWHRINVFES